MAKKTKRTVQAPLGIGIYSLPEAARLAQMPRNTLRRWLAGYRFPTKCRGGVSPPIFKSQLPEVEGHAALGFLDIVEVLFVKAFKDLGVSLPTIRKAAQKATVIWKTDHPFCVARLRTDGRSIFATIGSDNEDPGLLDLARSQWAFVKILEPYLTQVEYDLAGMAVRWWPLGKKRHVVVDPKFCFGKPIVVPGRIPTVHIYESFLADQSEAEVARWLEIPISCVRAAIQFEKSRAA